MSIREHMKRDLFWMPLLATFVYVCELARERWCPTLPMLIVVVLGVLCANALRKQAALPPVSASRD